MTNMAVSNLGPGVPQPDGFAPDETLQLTKLSSVLNGLENGASLIKRHLLDARRAVHAGTYNVEPIQLSRRIVGEALRSA